MKIDTRCLATRLLVALFAFVVGLLMSCGREEGQEGRDKGKCALATVAYLLIGDQEEESKIVVGNRCQVGVRVSWRCMSGV